MLFNKLSKLKKTRNRALELKTPFYSIAKEGRCGSQVRLCIHQRTRKNDSINCHSLHKREYDRSLPLRDDAVAKYASAFINEQEIMTQSISTVCTREYDRSLPLQAENSCNHHQPSNLVDAKATRPTVKAMPLESQNFMVLQSQPTFSGMNETSPLKNHTEIPAMFRSLFQPQHARPYRGTTHSLH